jgi:hypothetical protein
LVWDRVNEIEEVTVGAVSGDLVVLGLEESSSWRVVGLSLFVPCESSSGTGLVGRYVSVFLVLGGVLFWGSVCFGFGKLFKRTTVTPLLYPVLDLEETVEDDELEETVESEE